MNTWTARDDARLGIAGRVLAVAAFTTWLVAAAQAVGWLEVVGSTLGFACLVVMVWITRRHLRTYRGEAGGASLLLGWILAALVIGFVAFVWVMEGRPWGEMWDEERLSGLAHIVSSPLLYALPTWLASSGLLRDARGRPSPRDGSAASSA
jgi:hypothetical protein